MTVCIFAQTYRTNDLRLILHWYRLMPSLCLKLLIEISLSSWCCLIKTRQIKKSVNALLKSLFDSDYFIESLILMHKTWNVLPEFLLNVHWFAWYTCCLNILISNVVTAILIWDCFYCVSTLKSYAQYCSSLFRSLHTCKGKGSPIAFLP